MQETRSSKIQNKGSNHPISRFSFMILLFQKITDLLQSELIEKALENIHLAVLNLVACYFPEYKTAYYLNNKN
jgi:hypothetical protein